MLALVLALMLASMPAQAEPVGNLRSVAASASRDGVQGWDLQTDKERASASNCRPPTSSACRPAATAR